MTLESLRRNDCNPRLRERAQRRSALAFLEGCALAEHRARAHLGDPLAVDLDLQDAVEQQVDVGAFVVLLDEDLSFLELAALELLASREHLAGKLALERRLGLGDNRRRILVAP